MKKLKAGQLATLINKNMGIGCIIRVTKVKSASTFTCPECKKSNYEALMWTGACLMHILDKGCPETIPAPDLYPKVVKFFEV